ncbi:hypothetical protein V6N13_037567 [Hibiscus sabdariffa]
MHGLLEWTQVSIFYNSVNISTRMMLDASANGTLLDKPPREGLVILEKLAQNDYQHPTTRRGSMRRGTAQLDSSDTILAQISNLTNMVRQISQVLKSRPIGGFPSDTEVAKGATHEQCKAISIRSGKVLSPPTDNRKGETTIANPKAASDIDIPASADTPASVDEDHNIPFEHETTSAAPQPRRNTSEEQRLPPPFPQRLKKQKQEYQYKKFFDILKQVPAKKTDPESFTIHCSIGNNYSCKALRDPGASINLMSKSVFKKLGIGEAKPTTVMLQLADRSYVQPEGKIEDILVRVDKFIFPADFLIMDCEADEHAPIILGRPFLATGKVLLDFENNELVLRVNDQQVKINVFKVMKHPTDIEDCQAIWETTEFHPDSEVTCLGREFLMNLGSTTIEHDTLEKSNQADPETCNWAQHNPA